MLNVVAFIKMGLILAIQIDTLDFISTVNFWLAIYYSNFNITN